MATLRQRVSSYGGRHYSRVQLWRPFCRETQQICALGGRALPQMRHTCTLGGRPAAKPTKRALSAPRRLGSSRGGPRRPSAAAAAGSAHWFPLFVTWRGRCDPGSAHAPQRLGTRAGTTRPPGHHTPAGIRRPQPAPSVPSGAPGAQPRGSPVMPRSFEVQITGFSARNRPVICTTDGSETWERPVICTLGAHPKGRHPEWARHPYYRGT